MIGPNLRAASLFLQYDIGLTIRKVVRTVAGLAQFDFVPASLLRFGQEAARKARPLAQDVAEKLRACDANHADETYYRIDGKPAYVWFHGNEDLAHFYVTGTRSGKVSRTILGEDYQGGLITDCYSGYDRHATKIKQKCLSHLKRSAEDWCKLLPAEAKDSRAFFDAVRQWVKRGCTWHRKWKNRVRARKGSTRRLAAAGTGSSGTDADRFRSSRTSAETHPPLSQRVADVHGSSAASRPRTIWRSRRCGRW